MTVRNTLISKKSIAVIFPLWVFVCFIFIASASLYFFEIGKPREKVFAYEDEPKVYGMFTSLPQQNSTIEHDINYKDVRSAKLQAFFYHYRAPIEMINAASAYIQAADQYNLPWSLLPAIACKESGCGRMMPKDSNNPFGWGVWTGSNTGVNFTDFSNAIWHVSMKIRTDYFDKGFDTLGEIETKYTPPSANGSQHWQKDVDFFMNQIENWN